MTEIRDPADCNTMTEVRAGADEVDRQVVALLGEGHQQLADAFGYVAPAPGGPFRMIDWTDTAWGPAPVGVGTWAGCTLVSTDPPEVGWALRERAAQQVTLGELLGRHEELLAPGA